MIYATYWRWGSLVRKNFDTLEYAVAYLHEGEYYETLSAVGIYDANRNIAYFEEGSVSYDELRQANKLDTNHNFSSVEYYEGDY